MLSKNINFAFLFCLLLLPNIAVSQEAKACLNHLQSLEKETEVVDEMGGMWTLFEQSPQLRNHSTQAIRFDSKMSQLLELLHYLCATIDGVPLNDLAMFLFESLKLQSKEDFKKEQIFLGKGEAEIDTWLEFYEVSLQTQNRRLEVASVEKSIGKARPIFMEYRDLALQIRGNPSETQLESLKISNHKVMSLASSDRYLLQARHEIGQIPFWDIDENYGGS